MERKSASKKAASKKVAAKTRAKKPAASPKRTAKSTSTNTATQRSAATKTPATARTAKSARTPAVPASPAPRLSRRVVFIDVENTSSETTLLRVLDHLQIDRTARPTEVMAIGNWKSVGTKVARTLASLGTQLVHSAPAPGVRDWSDLWIAVTAGRWLGQASPGDQLDIVSDDRAFDAVHDAAAAVGVTCNRISYRQIPGAVSPTASQSTPASSSADKRPRRRRGGRGRGTGTRPAAAAVSPPAAVSPATPVSPAEHEAAHAASQEQIRNALARLMGTDNSRWINLDLLANALKTEGFSRPPGSPRLITRVRNIKGVEVSPNGMVRLSSAAAPDVADVAGGDDSAGPAESGLLETDATRRPRRRGGRRHRRRPAGNGDVASTPASEPPTTTNLEP